MRRSIVWNSDTCGSPSKEKPRIDFLEAGKPNGIATKVSRKPSRTKSCVNYFKEFTANTSLHGLKYVGEDRRSVAERIWWTIMFTLSVAACGHLMYKVWTKWQQSPVIVSFSETSTPVWQIPFPAITICAETKARQSVYNFTDYFHRHQEQNSTLTDEERHRFEALSLVCDSHLLHTGNKTTDQSTVEIIKSAAPQFEEMLWFCKWKSVISNCSSLFSPVLTDDGYCFSFNVLEADELYRNEVMHKDFDYFHHGKRTEGWSLDGGYPKNLPLNTFPERGSGYGQKAGLVILLRAYNKDIDYLCRGPVQGFKLLLHSPSEIHRMSQHSVRIPFSQETTLVIKPNMMTTSDGLRDYEPQRRQCYFPAERRLKYYKDYTQKNCALECLANFTAQRCGCVSFYMPRDNSMEICSSGSTPCVLKAEADLLLWDVNAGLANFGSLVNETDAEKKMRTASDNVASQCDCLSGCTQINYDVESSQADFNWVKLFKAFLEYNESESDMNMARVVIYYKDYQFITSRRSELYGQTDFLANCGGLLGLCLGFSVLSLVEIIYFVTLRAFCNLRSRIAKRTRNKNLAAVDHGDLYQPKGDGDEKK